MSRKIIIEGARPYGRIITKKLSNHKRKDDVYLIEEDEKLCEDSANKLDALVLHGKITDKDLDESLDNIDVFIAANADEGKNLLSCLYVKEHYKVDKIVSIVQTEEAKETFSKNGILTVHPEEAVTKILLRYIAGDPKLIDKITTSGQSELLAFEIKKESELDGQKISTIPVKPKHYNVVCVLRGDEILFAKPDDTLKEGDILQIAVDPKYHKKLRSYYK